MTQVAAPSESTGRDSPPRSIRSTFAALELDTRLLGMVVAAQPKRAEVVR